MLATIARSCWNGPNAEFAVCSTVRPLPVARNVEKTVQYMCRSDLCRLCGLSIIIYCCVLSGSGRASAIETTPPEWQRLGVPKSVDRSMELAWDEWKNYFVSFVQRAAAKRVTAADAEIFKRYLDVQPGDHPALVYDFVGEAAGFGNSKFKSDLIPHLRKLLKSKDDLVSSSAVESLSLFGDKESLPEIVALLGTVKHQASRKQIVLALERFGYELPYEEPSPAGTRE